MMPDEARTIVRLKYLPLTCEDHFRRLPTKAVIRLHRVLFGAGDTDALLVMHPGWMEAMGRARLITRLTEAQFRNPVYVDEVIETTLCAAVFFGEDLS
jgi:hypothetical protein